MMMILLERRVLFESKNVFYSFWYIAIFEWNNDSKPSLLFLKFIYIFKYKFHIIAVEVNRFEFIFIIIILL